MEEELEQALMTAFFEDPATLPSGLVKLFERSKVSLTLADATRPDCPLIAANAAFLDLSGYRAEDVIGRNCRFLQPEGGAGPVRARMRRFLKMDDVANERFLIPNRTADGEDFLNLVYMAKLGRDADRRLILGSQFRVGRRQGLAPDVYDRALKQDLRKLNELSSGSNWELLASLETLASSHSIIARMRYE